MATLILAAAGTALGGAVGGTVLGIGAAALGGFIGQSVGSLIDARLFGPGARKQEGPRLGDLAVQNSAYGTPLPLVFGTMRAAGNVIWSRGLIETRSEARSGGKGGGGSTTVNYSYAASFAVAVAAGEIAAIARVWADGKLLRDETGALAVGGEMRVYTGSEEQQPDPLIEAVEGSGGAPAFRGLAYVVFEALELAEYANRIPNLTFEVIAAGGPATLGGTIAAIAAEAGLDSVNASGLSAELKGFAIPGPMPARRALETLAAGFPFDAREEDGAIRFLGRPRAAARTIPDADLGAAVPGQGAALTVIQSHDAETPREILIRHIDPGRDYQGGAQRARRRAAASNTLREIEAPIALSASDAKRAAEIHLARAWTERRRVRFSLPIRHAALSAGDVVTLTHGGETLTVLIERMSFASGVLDCEGALQSAGVYQSAAAGDAGAIPLQEIAEPGVTTLHLLDLPPLTARAVAAPYFHAAAAGASSGWRGALLYMSSDEGASYDEIHAFASAAVMGVTTNALQSGPAAFWDRANALNVRLLNPLMTLESRPEAAVLNFANLAIVGDEVIAFRDAILEADGTYTLKHLLRGRFGGEYAIPGHAAEERFVLLDRRTIGEIAADGLTGKTRRFKAVSLRTSLQAAPFADFTFAARSLKPFAPVHATASRASNGDATIRWIRRARHGGDWIDGADVPLSEESEAYEIDILNGSLTVRTIAVTAPQALYTAAEQTADFGAPQAVLAIHICQISSAIGRGWPCDATI